MRNRIVVGMAFALAAGGLGGGDLVACGDKFLVPGRGVRFQRTVAERQASTLLIWAPPASPLAATLSKLELVASLGKAGYKPTVAVTAQDLERAASGGRWDVVVADAAEGTAVKARLQPPATTHMVAVTPKMTQTQMAEVRATYPVVLKAPSRAQDFLDAIDAAGASAFAERARIERAER